MTEHATELKACLVGRSTDRPCLFPATEVPSYLLPEGEMQMCAFHAAMEPLVEESNEFGVCLELLWDYLKGARSHYAAGPLVEVLERVEADFACRHALAEKVLNDLLAAESKLMRCQPS